MKQDTQLKTILIILVSLLLFNFVLMLSIKNNPVQEAKSKIISQQEDTQITEETNQKSVSRTIDSTNSIKKSSKISSSSSQNSQNSPPVDITHKPAAILSNIHTPLATTIDPYIYLDGTHYQYIAKANNPHPEDGPIQGATEINNGEDFAFVWQNGKVRFYHESELDSIRGNYNFSESGKMINHYQEFQTWAYPATGITEVPPGLWPGEYKYEICTGEPTCEQAIGYTWGDIVISDTDTLWFYTKDGEFKSRMAVFTNDMRDIAYDKEFNKFFATTTDFLRVLERNDKWLVFFAPRYCEPSSTTMCEGDPMGKPYALKILDMENSPLTKNMIISGKYAKQIELDGNYDRDTEDAITTNLAEGSSYISGIAYTNHYSVETIYYGGANNTFGGFYLYYGGYDPGKKNPSNVTRFTAHLQKNITYNTSYIDTKLISPENNANSTNKNIIFIYNVTSTIPITNCSLIINNLTLQTNTNITSGIQSFTQFLTEGNYTWQIGCYDSQSNFWLSGKRSLSIIPQKVKFRTTSTTYDAFTNISINENCDNNPLNLYSSKLFLVGLKNCTGEFGNSTLLIENIPYTGGMFGGLWECEIPFQMNLYKYSKGYYVCCLNKAEGYTLSKAYSIALNTTETTESLVSEREIFC